MEVVFIRRRIDGGLKIEVKPTSQGWDVSNSDCEETLIRFEPNIQSMKEYAIINNIKGIMLVFLSVDNDGIENYRIEFPSLNIDNLNMNYIRNGVLRMIEKTNNQET